MKLCIKTETIKRVNIAVIIHAKRLTRCLEAIAFQQINHAFLLHSHKAPALFQTNGVGIFVCAVGVRHSARTRN